jgi:hypothetical protein
MKTLILLGVIVPLVILAPSLSYAIGVITPNTSNTTTMTFDQARIGNITLGKEIAANDTALHQLSLDINKYQADHNVGIETADDLNILHNMCSYAAAEQSIAGVINITPGECLGTEK